MISQISTYILHMSGLRSQITSDLRSQMFVQKLPDISNVCWNLSEKETFLKKVSQKKGLYPSPKSHKNISFGHKTLIFGKYFESRATKYQVVTNPIYLPNIRTNLTVNRFISTIFWYLANLKYQMSNRLHVIDRVNSNIVIHT